jgi:hypothetical protein
MFFWNSNLYENQVAVIATSQFGQTCQTNHFFDSRLSKYVRQQHVIEIFDVIANMVAAKAA